MKCPKYHSDNPDTKQFCGDCGTQLTPIDGSLLPITIMEGLIRRVKRSAGRIGCMPSGALSSTTFSIARMRYFARTGGRFGPCVE